MSDLVMWICIGMMLIVLTEIFGPLYVKYFWHKPERRIQEIERQNALLDKIENF